MNAKLIQGAAGRVFSVVGDRYHFLVTGDGAGRMIVVVTPAGFEKFFAEIGTPLASPHDAPVEPVPEIEKPREKPPAPKPAEKPPEPKVPEKKPEAKKPEKDKVEAPPSIPASLPAAPVNGVQVVIPAAPKAKPIPALPNDPLPSIPTIIVPLNSK